MARISKACAPDEALETGEELGLIACFRAQRFQFGAKGDLLIEAWIGEAVALAGSACRQGRAEPFDLALLLAGSKCSITPPVSPSKPRPTSRH